MVIAVILTASFILFTVAAFASAYIPKKSAAPFFPTPPDAIRTALREASLKPGDVFYDLGAGTGTSLIIAEKEFGAKAIGFEISFFVYCVAKIKLFLRGARARIRFKNLYHVDIKDGDVIFCFLTERGLAKLEEKLKREAKPGARIVCYTFPLPTMKPVKTIPLQGQWKILIYRK